MNTTVSEIAFMADTQAPMWVETLLLRQHDNRKATAALFKDVLHRKPRTLCWLGDIVSLGYRTTNWLLIDRFLEESRKEGTRVYAIMGNHDVMGRAAKGARNFQKRFPEHVPTGYVSTTDSMAVVMLNSNFGILSAADQAKQQRWYLDQLASLDADPAIQAVIVTCHHAPYSNSRLVGSSKPVQQQFVPGYLKSRKACLFVTGHAHAFERFLIDGKNFLVIGGGGGLTQPLNTTTTRRHDEAAAYKPFFHYLTVQRMSDQLLVRSHRLRDDFAGCDEGYAFEIRTHP